MELSLIYTDWKNDVAKLYVQQTSICIEKENKEYTDVCLHPYLRHEIQKINWLPLGGGLDDWEIRKRHSTVYPFVPFGFLSILPIDKVNIDSL